MPTNLPPEYYKVEERYRQAREPAEKAELIEEMLSTIPKHKGTDKLRADLRRKLAKFKESAEQQKKTGRRDTTYVIDKEGAGQVVVVGSANTGKSSLVASLTNADPEVAEYPFATWLPTPGMAPYQNVQIQLIDTPSLDREFVEPALVDLIRRAELILVLLDIQAFPFDQLEHTLGFLEEHRIIPVERQQKFPQDRRHTFLPFVFFMNKVDYDSVDEDFETFLQLYDGPWTILSGSVKTGRGIEDLLGHIFQKLGVMRIFSKVPGKEADLSAPFIIHTGATVQEFAARIHKDFVKELKTARVWGSTAHDGLMAGRDHVLQDGDIVELKT
ncbi:MAG: TGS domain-containing protein [Anaerolineales bacterium]|jgi:ribosome-interacting GTPase 1